MSNNEHLITILRETAARVCIIDVETADDCTKVADELALAQWRPVETALINTEFLLLYVPDKGPVLSKWSSGITNWIELGSGNEISDATHWMPVPEAPIAKVEQPAASSEPQED